MSDSVAEDDVIQISPMTIDQLAGSFVLIMGAIGTLLLVIWQSRCECDMNLCYIIRCHRKPPPDEEIKKDKKKDKKKKGEAEKKGGAEEGAEAEEESQTSDEENARTPSLTPNAMN
tara:strand:- start:2205 stop:2552 length:348 start_codon:yes stop_codon:yes gene_type:complete